MTPAKRRAGRRRHPPSNATRDDLGLYMGSPDRVAPHVPWSEYRAACLDCGEWCSPGLPCVCCRHHSGEGAK